MPTYNALRINHLYMLVIANVTAYAVTVTLSVIPQRIITADVDTLERQADDA